MSSNAREIARIVRELKAARDRVRTGTATERDRETIRVIGGKIDAHHRDQRIICAGIRAQRLLESQGVTFTNHYSRGSHATKNGVTRKFMVGEELVLLALRAGAELGITRDDIKTVVDRVRYWAPQSELARIALKDYPGEVVAA